MAVVLIPVQSSNVVAVGVQPGALLIEYKISPGGGRSIYRYVARTPDTRDGPPAPDTLLDDLLAAPSKGLYVAHHVIGRYDMARLTLAEIEALS